MTDPVAVEKRIESLQERVSKLELISNGGGGGDGEETRGPKVKDEENHPYLKSLKPEGSGLELERTRAERDKGLLEVQALQEVITKQDYRIKHLLRALDAAEKRAATASASSSSSS